MLQKTNNSKTGGTVLTLGKNANHTEAVANAYDLEAVPTVNADEAYRSQPPAPSIHGVRRTNLRSLLRSFSQAQLANGQPSKGLEQAFAAHLQVSPSMLSQLKSSRNISDTLAAQIETLCGKPGGWLSQEHDHLPMNNHAAGVTENDFLRAARRAWANAKTTEERERLYFVVSGADQ